ncbi:LOW QUALITY PROTEIN: hypothetical protein HID58_015142 [Brassica napus]|uniref:Uncharacterized protein n=1 Tax=Brassica napus TaxID=3708 RepID=A0ABQ8DJ68_BRANA|nr:LOW QUALITY PROTEIN: hypothetical protein HID58_015142 [Brassica napus]
MGVFRLFLCKRSGGIEDDLHVFLLYLYAQKYGRWLLSLHYLSIPSITHLINSGTQFTFLSSVDLFLILRSWIIWRLWKTRNWFFFESRRTLQEIV